jgi:putative ABC transport system permease protein
MLTMLGIIIGVGAVVLMSSIGASMQGVILGQISTLGPRSMVIFPGKEEGGASAVATGFDSITFDDIDALKKLSSITSVAPIIFVPGVASFGSEETNPETQGVTPEFFRNQSIGLSMGRLFDKSDDEGARAVAVLGSETAYKLFGNIDPLGKRVRVGQTTFTVIGVAKPIGTQFFQNADLRIYVPYTVARNATGQKYVNFVTMNSQGNFDLALADVKALLRQQHNIENPNDDPEKDDFIVRTSEQASQILGGVSLGLTMFITMIATISLLVGGIGIMNIMLVTVTERTSEIGLRKAIGARRRDILLQFLLESILLTVFGGIIGIVLGISFAMFAALVVKNVLDTYGFAISVPSIITSFLMATGTGLFFGISPARKAASLSPMEALRYE